MDPIKKLISDADPMKSDPLPVPDGEQALRRMFSDPSAFSDVLLPPVASLDAARRRRTRLAALVTMAAAAVTAGVLVATNLGSLSSLPAPAGTVTATEAAEATATPSSTSSPTPTSTPTPAAPVAWTTFRDATGQATFEHPVGWTASEQPATVDGRQINTVVVKNAEGKEVSTLSLFTQGPVGGYMCPVPKPLFTLDSVALDIPQKAAKLKESRRGPSEFAFRVIQSDKVYGTMALNDRELTPTTTACVLHNGILGPDNAPFASFGDVSYLQQDGGVWPAGSAPLTFATLAEAEAFKQTQEYQDLKRMLISLELRAPATKPVTWTQYTSENGLGSFEYPDNWSVRSREAGRYSDVVDDKGRTLLTLGFGQTRNVPNLISPCPAFTVLESTPMNFPSNRQGPRAIPPQFIFRVWDVSTLSGSGTNARFVANLGIADESWGVNGTTCDPQNVVSGLPSGEYFFAQNYNTGAESDLKFNSMEEARAYMQTGEFSTLKRIVTSLKINSQ